MNPVPVYNLEGKETATVNLEPKIFDVVINPVVVQQAVRTLQAQSRVAIAHAKTRSEVRGGGKKPWAQKGTGRARHGSIRSPIWKGGGVTFGPRADRNYELKMNQKARRKALFMALTDKVRDQQLIIVEALDLKEVKTRQLVAGLRKLPKNGKTLIVLPEMNETIIKSARNVAWLSTIQANSLNVLSVLGHQRVIVPQTSLKIINKTYL